MTPQHIPLKERRALSARLIGFPLIHINPAPSVKRGDPSARSALRSLGQDLVQLSADGLEEQAGPLDKFLVGLSRDLKDKAKPSLRRKATTTKLIKNILRNVEMEISNICCEKCALGKALICNGKNVDEDAKVVAKNGQCIKRLKEMFDASEATARAYYNHFSTIFSTLSRPIRVEFSTQDFKAIPHEFPVPYQVGGVTSFEDQPGEWVSRVCLNLWVQRFDWATYVACLYVFFHECICHAFKGTAGSSRITGKSSDPLSEGWMDWLSVTILRDCLNGTAAPVPNFPLVDIGQFGKAQHYHDQRLNFDIDNAADFADLWAVGREAAQKLKYLLAILPESKADPERAFLELSFDFNLQPYEWYERERFVKVLDKHLPRRGEHDVKRQKKYYRVVSIISKYLKNKVLDRMVTDVLSL